MSDGPRYSASVALGAAMLVAANLRSVTHQIEIVGSLRRLISRYGHDFPKDEEGKDELEVGDIEILAVPKMDEMVVPAADFFSEPTTKPVNCLLERVSTIYEPFVKMNKVNVPDIKWGKRYRRLGAPVPGNADRLIPCDLFLIEPENWGVQCAIRTGPAAFSEALVKKRMAEGFRFTGAGLTLHGKHIVVATERELFDVLDLPYIPPHQR